MRVRDPLHFGADPDPRIRTSYLWILDPPLDPTLFFSYFKYYFKYEKKLILLIFCLITYPQAHYL
jgi:hypothetical protein